MYRDREAASENRENLKRARERNEDWSRSGKGMSLMCDEPNSQTQSYASAKSGGKSRVDTQTAAAGGYRTLPCVLWSGTLQLSWSVPLPPLCGPQSWTHSALCCLLCLPKNKNSNNKQRFQYHKRKSSSTCPIEAVQHPHIVCEDLVSFLS